MTRQLSKGTCTFCHAEYSKSAMTRHLATCQQRASRETQAEDRQGLQKMRRFHLLIEGRSLPMYWLHLDITSQSTLTTLDQFLRDIWLECCGHLSAFEIEGVQYLVDDGFSPGWNRRQKRMWVHLDQILRPGLTYSYEYDFGSTTELTLKVLSEREAAAPGKPLEVLARNNPFPASCQRCGEPATCLCRECQYAARGNLCDGCAKEHACGEEMLFPLVNSPREGVCGYTGQQSSGSG